MMGKDEGDKPIKNTGYYPPLPLTPSHQGRGNFKTIIY
jgi:hypothetical protein